jgi:hypothetical protein
MTEPTPTPETQNSPAAPDSEKTRQDSADKTGFFNRVQRELKPKSHPTEEQEIVVEMTPIKNTDSDEQT